MTFTCPVCRQLLSADSEFAGKKMRCPLCEATINVPSSAAAVPERELVGATAGPQNLPPARNSPPLRRIVAPPLTSSNQGFSFTCVYCSSRLEATQSMSGTQGQCPTCGSAIYIPILNRSGQLIDPVTQKIIKPDPHPVHAYAAAGERAPAILREESGKQIIVCRRCGESNPIVANNCRGCGMPFTIEGTANVASTSSGYGAASLVLGIVALPLSCLLVPGVLAIIFGILALRPATAAGGGKGTAIAGLVLGTISLLIFVALRSHLW